MLWRKVPESDVLEEGAGKRCFRGRCRKAMLGVCPCPRAWENKPRPSPLPRSNLRENAHQHYPDGQQTAELNILTPAASVFVKRVFQVTPNETSLYWAIQAGLLTPLTFAWHRLSPLAAFTSGVYFLHNGRR